MTNVLKQVQHDVDGPPAVTLYRVLFAYYMTYNGHDSLRGKEVEKLVGCAVIDLLTLSLSMWGSLHLPNYTLSTILCILYCRLFLHNIIRNHEES